MRYDGDVPPGSVGGGGGGGGWVERSELTTNRNNLYFIWLYLCMYHLQLKA